MPYKDPEKQRAAQRKSHEKLRDHRRAKQGARKQEAREALQKLKNVPCTDCGNRYPYYVMQFDHVRGEKIGNVSRLLNNGQLALALAEVAKCEVVCANCHAERSWQRLQPTSLYGPKDTTTLS